MSTSRVASATSLAPQALKNSLPPPNVPVPKLSTGTLKPERPNCRYSMRIFSFLPSRADMGVGREIKSDVQIDGTACFNRPPTRTGSMRSRQASCIGLDEHAAERGRAGRRREAAGRHLPGEALQGFELLHADDAVVIGAGARIGLIGGAAGQNICASAVGTCEWVPTTRLARPSQKWPMRHFLGCRFGMHVDHDRVGAFAQRTGIELGVDGGEGIVQRIHEHAAHRVDHQHAPACARLEQPGAFARACQADNCADAGCGPRDR